MALILFQITVFFLYIGFLLIRFKGPLPSISDSWYRLSFPQNSLFWVFCTAMGISNIFQSNGDTALFFLAGVGLCMTGVLSAFNSKNADFTKMLHFTGALVCILGSLIGLGIERTFWFSSIVFILLSLLILLLGIKNRIWWIEITAFGCILAGYIITWYETTFL